MTAFIVSILILLFATVAGFFLIKGILTYYEKELITTADFSVQDLGVQKRYRFVTDSRNKMMTSLMGGVICAIFLLILFGWTTYSYPPDEAPTPKPVEEEIQEVVITQQEPPKPVLKPAPKIEVREVKKEIEEDTVEFELPDPGEDFGTFVPEPEPEEEEVVPQGPFFNTDTPAEFPGGDFGLVNYVVDRFDKSLVSNPGAVVVEYIIETNGRVTGVKVLESTYGPAVNNEAVRIVKTLKYTSGPKNDGMPVRQVYQLPIIFQ